MLTSIAPLIFVLLWSSSFISTKDGLAYLSPLLFVAVRLALCAVVLVTLAAAFRQPGRTLSVRQALHCAVAGMLLNGVALMGPHAGLVIAPAAQIALVQALTPLLTAALGVVLLREPLRTRQWAGLFLGLAGVGLVLGRTALQSPTQFDGLMLAFLGVVGMVGGTLYFARFCRDAPFLPGAAAQFAAAAALAAVSSLLLETPRAEWTGSALAALAWNTLVVSLGGMGLYVAMLTRHAAARITSAFYLVPGAVALLAWLLLGERLTPTSIAGIVVASAGCWLVSAEPAKASRV